MSCSSQDETKCEPKEMDPVSKSTNHDLASANAPAVDSGSKGANAIPSTAKTTDVKASHPNHGRGTSTSSGDSLLDSTTTPFRPHTGGDVRWDAINLANSKESPLGLSHFRLLKRLGYGDIGSVYLVQLNGTAAHFAMKVMDKASLASRNKLLRAQTEREILGLLDHPFLPTLYSYFETDKLYCLVMEFCSGGNLHSLRQKQPNKYFTEEAARSAPFLLHLLHLLDSLLLPVFISPIFPLLQVLCIRGVAGTRVSAHARHRVQGSQARKRASKGRRSYHALRLRPLTPVFRLSDAGQVFIGKQCRGRRQYQQRCNSRRRVCSAELHPALKFPPTHSTNQEKPEIQIGFRPLRGRVASRTDGRAHKREVDVVRGNPRILGPGDHKRRGAWQRSRLVDVRDILVRAAAWNDPLQGTRQPGHTVQRGGAAIKISRLPNSELRGSRPDQRAVGEGTAEANRVQKGCHGNKAAPLL